METSKTLVLTGEDVQKIVATFGVDAVMDRTIDELERTLTHYDRSSFHTPARSGFHYYEPHLGLIEWMPIYKGSEQVTLKIVGYHPNNPKNFRLPTIISTTSSYNSATGHLDCLMDATLTTAIRTGAASALASKYLAQPGSETLGLIGCGAQAVTQLHALSRIFSLKRVLFYDTDPEAELSFPSRCDGSPVDVEFRRAPIEEIVSQSDILCTATSIEPGQGPLFQNLPTKDDLHINAVGADFPGKIEIPKDLLLQSMVCPDFVEQAVVEGECQQLESTDIGLDLTELIQQKATKFQSQRTVFDSTGWALEDQVMLDIFRAFASELGLGRWLDIETTSQDEKNPYHFLLPVTNAIQ